MVRIVVVYDVRHGIIVWVLPPYVSCMRIQGGKCTWHATTRVGRSVWVGACEIECGGRRRAGREEGREERERKREERCNGRGKASRPPQAKLRLAFKPHP